MVVGGSSEATTQRRGREQLVRSNPDAARRMPRIPREDRGRQLSRGGSLVRKIKSSFFISLDGVVESPDQWHFPYFDDEMGAAVSAAFANADAILMGRVLYNEWAAFWPEHADEPFGDVMNSI